MRSIGICIQVRQSHRRNGRGWATVVAGIAGWLVAASVVAPGPVLAQVVQDGFDPEVDGLVRVVEPMRDGRLLVGGDFTAVDGVPRSRLARLDNQGLIDLGFDVEIGGAGTQTRVRAIRHQAGGRILVGGHFTSVAGQPRSHLARLTSAGVLDAGFQVPLDGDVHALWDAPEISGGPLYIGGDFALVHGQPRSRVARLNADGTLSAGFVPPQMNGGVWTLQPHTRPGGVAGLLVAGSFGEIDGQPVAAPIVRLSRIDGSVDTGFQVSTSSTVFFGNTIADVAVQRDGKVLIAGHFDTVHGEPRANLARLHPDGSLDQDFLPPAFDAPLTRVRVLADDRIVVVGNFSNSPLRRNVARLRADGGWDEGFNSLMLADRVDALAVQADGKLVVGGLVSQVGAYPLGNLARLYPDGVPEVDFMPDGRLAERVVWSLAIEADGRLLVGQAGAILDQRPLLRLNRNGSVVASFDPPLANGPAAFVQAIAVQPDGRILVAAHGSGIPVPLRRFHADGSADASFQVAVDGQVFALSLQPDGSVVFGGAFGAVDGQPRAGLARVDANGQLDPSFVPTTDGLVTAIVRQPDARLLIAGDFQVVNSVGRRHLARLNHDGSLDPGFEADLDDRVLTMAVQNDGRILIGGAFDSVDGQQRRGIARLNADGSHDVAFAAPTGYDPDTIVQAIQLMPDGRILFAGIQPPVSGPGTTAFLRRLAATGQPLHSRLFTQTGQADLQTLAIDSDGHAYVGGVALGDSDEGRIAVDRVPQAAFSLDSLFRLGKETLVWQHRGAGAALAGPPWLEVAASCCDEAGFLPVDGAWFALGGTVDQWSLDGLDIPGTGTVWVRARGMAGAAGSQYPITSPVLAIDLEDDDTLFANGFE